jgi:DNA-binding MarR family transcriptional regulator
MVRQKTSQSVMFNQAIAERLGINATDLRCVDILSRTGAITAGQLAELTGLTTGAITGVANRLEQAGLVRREPDPEDRRRVILRPVRDRDREVEALFDPLARAWEMLCERYSDEELSFILEFMKRTRDMLHEETERLRVAPHSR